MRLSATGNAVVMTSIVRSVPASSRPQAPPKPAPRASEPPSPKPRAPSRELRLPQRRERINPRRAPGGNETGDHGGHNHHAGDDDERKRIRRRHVEEHRAEQARQPERGAEADNETRHREQEPAAEDEPQDRRRGPRRAPCECRSPGVADSRDTRGRHTCPRRRARARGRRRSSRSTRQEARPRDRVVDDVSIERMRTIGSPASSSGTARRKLARAHRAAPAIGRRSSSRRARSSANFGTCSVSM